MKVDGHNADDIRGALDEARSESTYPTLVICRTHIGYGSPNKVDTSASHGAPLGTDELANTRATLNWTHEPFEVPSHVRDYFASAQSRKQAESAEWHAPSRPGRLVIQNYGRVSTKA